MKKLLTAIFVSLFLFAASSPAHAVPMYYTFDGYATSVTDPTGAIASQLGFGFGLGSSVTYTLIVDFATDGTRTLNDVGGTVFNETDTATNDFFYADYVSGDALAQVGGGVYNATTDVAEYNYGVNDLSGTAGYLRVNSSDDLLEIYSYANTVTVSNWVEGTTNLVGRNQAYASDGTSSVLYANLTLTSIAPVNAVPEPSTILLLGSGLIGLGFFRRKTALRQAQNGATV